MAEEFVFHDLIAALQDAIVKANVMAQQAHLDSMRTWFDEKGHPKMMEITLPKNPVTDIRKKHESSLQKIQVPLLTMVPLSATKLDEIKVKFNLSFSELLSTQKQEASADNSSEQPEYRLNSNFAKKYEVLDQGNMAQVEITIKGTEPPEALVRINDYLLNFLP